jgi:hypothetical protein
MDIACAPRSLESDRNFNKDTFRASSGVTPFVLSLIFIAPMALMHSRKLSLSRTSVSVRLNLAVPETSQCLETYSGTSYNVFHPNMSITEVTWDTQRAALLESLAIRARRLGAPLPPTFIGAEDNTLEPDTAAETAWSGLLDFAPEAGPGVLRVSGRAVDVLALFKAVHAAGGSYRVSITPACVAGSSLSMRNLKLIPPRTGER